MHMRKLLYIIMAMRTAAITLDFVQSPYGIPGLKTWYLHRNQYIYMCSISVCKVKPNME